MASENFGNALSSVISQGGGIASGDTTVTVTSTLNWPQPNFRILIEAEICLVTGVSGNTFTISRGQEGTVAAAHANGATVTQVLTVGGLLGEAGDFNLSDSYAALPSSSLLGRLFLPTDGISVLRDTSTLWTRWGPVYPMTAPPADTGQTTTLSGNGGSINNSTTTIHVASSTGFPATPFLVQIGTEDLSVTTVAGTTWTVTRGYNGTTAASHNDGDTVTQINWEWVNQGTGSVSRFAGGIFLKAPANTTGNARIRKNIAPTTPYTITAFLSAISYSVDFNQYGLLFRKSSTGELKTFDFIHDGGNGFVIRITYWSSATTQVSASAEFTVPHPFGWMQISDDGTNRIYRLSSDGQNWIQHFSESRTATITADEIGFFANSQNSQSLDVGATLHSWKQS